MPSPYAKILAREAAKSSIRAEMATIEAELASEIDIAVHRICRELADKHGIHDSAHYPRYLADDLPTVDAFDRACKTLAENM